jgi:glucose-fructose oxidoreductase
MARRSRSARSQPRVRYAVVGLGYISQVAALPAFAHATKNSELAALVSDDPKKLEALGKRYRIDERYSYDDYERCLEQADIDAVYIGLPNDMHREYTERAARMGVHVLCEKPMEVTIEDCGAMIEAAETNGVRLMIAYRLHFEKANLKAIELVQSGRLGDPRVFNSVFTMQVKDEDNIRLQSKRGGGTLYDIGIYCINAARYLFRAEPDEVYAKTANNGEKRFREVEEMTSAVLRFPDERLATFTCSFGAADVATYQVVGTEGDVRLDSAYEYAEEITMTTTIKGKKKQQSFPQRDQFAPELLHFSDCVLSGRDPSPSGREGLADVRIIQALYRSAEMGRPVTLKDFDPGRRPVPEQEIERPAVKEPELVHANPPGKG